MEEAARKEAHGEKERLNWDGEFERDVGAGC